MNVFYFGNTLNYAGLLMLCALGSAFAIKNGQMNLGGEGQVYAGGFVSAVLLNFFSGTAFFENADGLILGLKSFSALFVTALASMMICAAFTFFSSVLRIKRGAKELLTTFLMSAAIIPLIDGALSGRFRTSEGNLLATPFIQENFRFAHILPPSDFNVTFFFSAFLCVLGGYVLYKTAFGKRLCIFGTAEEFAVYSGFNKNSSIIVPMLISGALHGLAGFFAVTGTYYTCHEGFYAGLGWNGLSCALLSRSNPYIVIAVSVFLSVIYTFADRIVLTYNFGFDVSVLMQGIVLLITAFSLVFSGKIHFSQFERIDFLSSIGRKFKIRSTK